MQRCQNCGAELPRHARFCGVCGGAVDTNTDWPTYPSDPSGADLRSINIPTEQNSQTYSASMNAGQEQQGLDVPIRHVGPENEPNEKSPFSQNREFDDHQVIWPDLLLPGMADKQTPPINIPRVQGTPQPGGVPTVQGSPTTPNTPPAWAAHMQQSGHIIGRTPPVHQPQRHPPKPFHYLHAGSLSRQHLRNTAAKIMANTTSRWILLVVVAIVVLASSGIGLILAHQPPPLTLSLGGGSNVTPGSVLSVHGSGFSPGGTVTLSRDQGSSLLSGDRTALGNPSFAGQADAALTLHMSSTGQSNQSNAPIISIKVRIDGTFDASIVVRQDWSQGSHTIHATDENTSRRVDREFTIIPMPAKLAVSTPLLDFGKLEKGNKPVRSVAVTNAGAQRLNWTADIGSASWLKLQSKAGAIELNGSQEFIYVIADTTSLQVGSYSGALRIKSNGGKALVTVQLQVVSSVPKQARLAVAPTTLGFGQLQVGQQSTLTVAVSNGGIDVLNWKANTGNTSWLALYPDTGTVKPGAVPQIIQVTANTANLLPGNYAATLQISSNGGNESIQVTLVVTHSQPGPPPPPAMLTASPYSFNTPGDPNCSYSADSGWVCTATLSSYKNASGNLSWTASSSGVGGVTFTPSQGVLSPGQTTKVTIAIPNGTCPSQATFTFKGPGNTADVLWFCGAPTWTFSPGKFKADKDCQYMANAGWTCDGLLAETQGSEGNLKWTASSEGIDGIKFSPSSGRLSPNRPVQVTISVANTQCPASAILNFSAPGVIPIAVPWRCGGGTTRLIVDPDSLQAYSDCPGNDDRGWTCKVTLRSDSESQGKLTWSASADSELSGVNFDPPSGTLAPGENVKVTIFIPGNDDNCINSSFYFTGSDNIATAQWYCKVIPPQITVKPDRLSSDDTSNCAANDYGWLCNVTVEPADGAQSDLYWSAKTGLDGVIFTPSDGTVPPGKSMLVTIVIPNSACRDGVFTFAGQGLNNSADVTWHCTSYRTLTADPKSLSTKDTSNCTSTDTGWNCTVALQETTDSRGKLDWSAETGLPGVTFSPPSGELSPGQDGTRISISIPSADCPNSGSFTFIGPENTVDVPWSCEVSPNWIVGVNPGSFNVNKDCDGGSESQAWVCTAVLNSGSKNPSALDWSASASGASGIYFITPAGGTLTPGQAVQVEIAVPNTACTQKTTGSFIFSFSGPVNSVNVPWNCSSPPRITIDHDTFNANGNCSSGNGGWNCTTTVAPEPGSQGDLPWSASSDVPGTTFYPSSGTVPSGQSMAVNIFVPACQDGTFSFKGPINTAPAHWHCALAPTLTVSPNDLTQSNSSCSGEGNSWTCTETVGESTGSQGDLTWSASSSLPGVSFNPPNGTLSPGGSVDVTISSLSCQAATFTFSGSGGTKPITSSWSCTPAPPILIASPTSLDTNSCTSLTTAWQCSVTLTETAGSLGNLKWSASSDANATQFSPSSGTLSPGLSTTVTITVSCANSNFTFTGGASPISVSWSCKPILVPSGDPTPTPDPTVSPSPSPSPSPTRILLWSASPSSLDSNTCGASGTCTVTLTEDAKSTGNIDWTASSDVGATFNPAGGTLTPGGQQQVSISGMACQNGTFTFTGPAEAKALVVSWSCASPSPSPSPSPTPTNTPTPVPPTPTPTPTNTPTPVPPTPTPTDTPTPVPPTPTPVPPTPTPVPPTPTLLWSASPSSLDSNTCGASGPCTVTLTEDAKSTGNIDWTASSDVGATFNPAGGTLTPGGQQQVSISGMACQNGTFTFTGPAGAKALTVSWSCASPSPSPSPTPTDTPTPVPPTPTDTPTPMPPTSTPTPTP